MTVSWSRSLLREKDFGLSSQSGASTTISDKHRPESLSPRTPSCSNLPCPVHCRSPGTCLNHTLCIDFQHYPHIWCSLAGNLSTDCWDSKTLLPCTGHSCWKSWSKKRRCLSTLRWSPRQWFPWLTAPFLWILWLWPFRSLFDFSLSTHSHQQNCQWLCWYLQRICL